MTTDIETIEQVAMAIDSLRQWLKELSEFTGFEYSEFEEEIKDSVDWFQDLAASIREDQVKNP